MIVATQPRTLLCAALLTCASPGFVLRWPATRASARGFRPRRARCARARGPARAVGSEAESRADAHALEGEAVIFPAGWSAERLVHHEGLDLHDLAGLDLEQLGQMQRARASHAHG